MITIRPAQPSDADPLLALARDFATSFKVEEPAFRASLAALLGDDAACLRVAENKTGLAGYVLGFQHPAFFANGPVAWVEEIMVVEQVRKQGVGRLLMEDFESWARSRHCRLVALATRRAADFYRALGYQESAAYFRKML